jgi:hypothetical protein
MTIDARAIAKRMWHLVEKAGGQGKAAQLAGVTRGTIQKWRTGGARIPLVEAHLLAQAGEIDLIWLVTGRNQDRPQVSARPATRVVREAAAVYAADPQFGVARLIEGLCRASGLSEAEAYRVQQEFFTAVQIASDKRATLIKPPT